MSLPRPYSHPRLSSLSSVAALLWARCCWYHRGNWHSIRRDESILFSAKNKLLMGAYFARSSIHATYLLSSSIPPLSHFLFLSPSLITFLRIYLEFKIKFMHFLVTSSITAYATNVLSFSRCVVNYTSQAILTIFSQLIVNYMSRIILIIYFIDFINS